jgi:hypothetical protein
MRRQEVKYSKTPFLHQQQLEHDPKVTTALHVDADCRIKMTAWTYQVLDFCRFSRETAEIAMSYLDRFVATPAGQSVREDRQVYQLAAMSCLYTAVKINEPEAMNPQLVSNLSRGAYSPHQVEEMEATILKALDWYVNPPTSLSYVRLLLDILPADVLPKKVHQTAYDLSKYQTELAVHEYDMITVKSSTIGFCALLNALESLAIDSMVLDEIATVLADAIDLDVTDSIVRKVSNWLYESVVRQNSGDVFLQQPTCASSVKQTVLTRRMSIDVSPRTVAMEARE